ncbi:MAG: DUF885 domain-containing protein [Flavobacteriales bacterium]|nr:DUF885 domain-containing protein [Flavobacteriales bacterium]
MRKGLTISLVIVVVVLLALGVWFAKLLWLKPFSIDNFFERVYIEFLWNDPEALTQTKVLSPFGISSYERELTNVSPTATRRLAEVGRKNLAILEDYDCENLSKSQQVSYDVFHWFLKTGVEAEPFLFHDFPITHISGAHIELPQFLTSLPFEQEADVENYLQRLNVVDEKFGSVIDALEERRKLGVIPPTHILLKAMNFCDAFYESPLDENILYTSFVKRLDGMGNLSQRKKQDFLDRCTISIQEKVFPAYKRLSGFLLQLERNSLSIAGVWQLPDGDAYYRSCLLQQTTLRLDPDSLYEFGKLEMARLQGEILILKNLSGAVSEPTFKTDSIGRLATVAYFAKVSDEMMLKLPAYFNKLPTVPLSVLEVPEYRSQNSTFAFYISPRGEPLANGKLYVNTWKADHLTKPLAKTYAYHEGIPGHHLQKGIQAGLTTLPTFRRFLPFTAYTEGWAMYAERLGHEMNESLNPQDRIAVLQSDLFRTARMMTDIGIHHKMWLREQAIDFMVDNAGLSELEAEDEVDRYIVWPGQGCAYKVGQLKFIELRERAESELGNNFDTREFHDVLIGQGAMPLEILEKQVLEYIEERKPKG